MSSQVTPAVPELSCQELVELITDYLEGALPEAERKRFDAHLADCPHCRVYLEQMQVTVGALGRLEQRDVPPAALDELMRTFRDWKARGRFG